MKIQSGDEVLVIAGKDKGKRGRVRTVFRDRDRVVVEGANMVKKHQKARPGVQQSGIVEQENPLHVSNVMLFCPNCSTPARLGVRRSEAGHKQRFCRNCGQSVDRR